MADQDGKIKWLKEHAEALDRNWNAHHEACMGAIYGACRLTEGTVPEAVKVIEELRRQRDVLHAALRSVPAIAADALRAWQIDQDHRVGKILKALAGEGEGYRADVDAIHTASALCEKENP